MSRLTWFAVGAVTGGYGILKARQAARNLTPEGVTARARAAGAGLRVFSAEVAAGMAERESELRDEAARGGPGGPAVAVPAMIEGSAGPRHRRGRSSLDHSSEELSTDGHR